MNIELITTGTELLCGKILNTHLHSLGTRLLHMGFRLTRQTSVPDDSESITQAVVEAFGRVNVVITTGGLGPTSDDLTRNAVAKLFGKELIVDKSALENIEKFFQS